jgi:polysaccharide export outer membrane protein
MPGQPDHPRMSSSLIVRALAGTLLLISLLASGCVTGPFIWIDDYPVERDDDDTAYRIRTNDRLQISVWRQPELSTAAWVRPDGKISVALAGDVKVVGLTPSDAAKAVEGALKGKVTAPVSVTVVESRADTVAVLGEVADPGRYTIKTGDTVLDALAQAGGLTQYARRDRIFVLRRREQSRIRFTYEKLSGTSPRAIAFQLEDGDIIVVE